jgi:hypothetical protein
MASRKRRSLWRRSAVSRETIGLIMYRELPDDDKPFMETHALSFMPVEDTESDEFHTRVIPWSKQEAKMNAALGLRAVLVVRADVERIGTKINMSNYNCHLVEGLSEEMKANVERLVTPVMFRTMLDKFYDDLLEKRKASRD